MLTRLLHKAVRADPAKIAIVHDEERISYDELLRRVQRCAAGLHGLGVRAGDCVAAVLHNCPEFVIAFFACAQMRAIFLPLNPQYRGAELRRFIADADARAVIASGSSVSSCRDALAEQGRSVPIVAVGKEMPGTISFSSLAQSAPSECRLPEETDATASIQSGPARALYLYTSGSTDSYKRVCFTQENLFFEAHNFIETMQLEPADTILCTIPLYHSYGFGNCLLDAVYLGATLVILEAELPAGVGGEVPFVNRCSRVAELLRTENVHFYPGVPYQFGVLAALPVNFPIDLSGLRLCVSSGDILPKHTYDRFLLRFNHPIHSLYGSTEAGSISIDTDAAGTAGSLGRPLKNVIIEIRGEDGRERPPGQDGEIWVRSPSLPSAGYDNRPELSAKAFHDGYYNTGDIGHKDERGRLRIVGRKQTFVDIAGYKVDLGEVEEVLQGCPGVREAAVLSVDIPNMGTLIKAVVAPESCSETDIRSFCRERMAFVKVPRIIEMCAELPRSPIGKVLKSELADVTAYLARIRSGNSGIWLKQLPGAAPERRRRLLRMLIQAQVAAVLGRTPDEVASNLGFTELGMDSFASIELRARLEYLLGRPFPETFTFDHPTVAAIVDHLLLTLPPADVESTTGKLEP